MEYWEKQTDSPLFPELEWDKPERRDQAGRLLIVGGYQHNLNAPGKAYEYTKQEGIGTIHIALPKKVKSLVGPTLPGAIFLPNTASGELAQDGLEELMAHANVVDTVLMPGDIGRNSQTTLLFTDLLSHTTQQAIVARDTVDSLKNTPDLLVDREHTTLILSFAELQKIVQNLKLPTALTFGMDLIKLVEFLHEFTGEHPCAIITLHQEKYIVAVNGSVTTTPVGSEKTWRVRAASLAACYQTWNPAKPLEALSYSVWRLRSTAAST